MSQWYQVLPNGQMVPIKQKPRIVVRWWWYFSTILAASLLCAVILTACGDDDDDGVNAPAYGDDSWFTTTSPSGVDVECLAVSGRRGSQSIWCMEVPK